MITTQKSDLHDGYNILYRGEKLGAVLKEGRTWTAIILLGAGAASQLTKPALTVGDGLRTRREAILEITLSTYAEERKWDLDERLARTQA